MAQQEVLFVGGAPLDSHQPRIIIPLLEEAFRRNGILFSVETHPSARSLVISNSGEADGELHRVHNFHVVTDGRYPNLVRIDSQLMSVYRAVFSTKSALITDMSELAGYRVAYQRGRKSEAHDLEQAIDKSNLYPKNTDLIAFKMLASGRVDYVISESLDGQRLIKTYPELQNIQEVGRLKETRIYAYMHKKHGELADTIATTLEEMKKDGTFNRITDEMRATILSGK